MKTLPASVAPPPDPARCPLCGGPNACPMSCVTPAGGPGQDAPCWCTQVTFSAETLARVPPAARHKACICKACASS